MPLMASMPPALAVIGLPLASVKLKEPVKPVEVSPKDRLDADRWCHKPAIPQRRLRP